MGLFGAVMGRRVDRIAALETKQERHTYKAKQHLLAIGRLPRVVPFSDGGQCTITEASVIGSDLKIVIELEKDGVVIPCLGPGDVLTIRNPGVCVEDPAGVFAFSRVSPERPLFAYSTRTWPARCALYSQ